MAPGIWILLPKYSVTGRFHLFTKLLLYKCSGKVWKDSLAVVGSASACEFYHALALIFPGELGDDWYGNSANRISSEYMEILPHFTSFLLITTIHCQLLEKMKINYDQVSTGKTYTWFLRFSQPVILFEVTTADKI